MVLVEFLRQILYTLLTLFLILDPFLSLAIFISLTKSMNAQEKAKQALVASGVAFGLLTVFLFIGKFLLDLLKITLESIMVGGGVILFLLGIQAILGLEFARKKKDYKMAAVVIGTPLLCGPGAITTIMIMSNSYGYWPPLIASLLACLATYSILVNAEKISKLIGERMIEVISRVLGFFLCIIATENIKVGIIMMIKGAK